MVCHGRFTVVHYVILVPVLTSSCKLDIYEHPSKDHYDSLFSDRKDNQGSALAYPSRFVLLSNIQKMTEAWEASQLLITTDNRYMIQDIIALTFFPGNRVPVSKCFPANFECIRTFRVESLRISEWLLSLSSATSCCWGWLHQFWTWDIRHTITAARKTSTSQFHRSEPKRSTSRAFDQLIRYSLANAGCSLRSWNITLCSNILVTLSWTSASSTNRRWPECSVFTVWALILSFPRMRWLQWLRGSSILLVCQRKMSLKSLQWNFATQQ